MEPSFLSGETVTVTDTPAAAPPPPKLPLPAPPAYAAPPAAAAPGPATAPGVSSVTMVEPAGPAAFLPAALGGLVGALIGAAVFATVGVATDFEIGYIAVLIGFLAGRGVHLGARGAFAPSLKLLAGGLAVFGVVASKYMMLAYVVSDKTGLSFFAGRIFGAFVDHFADMLSPFDILWVGLAVAAAARAVKPSVVR